MSEVLFSLELGSAWVISIIPFRVMLIPMGGIMIKFFIPIILSECSLQLIEEGLETVVVTGGLSEPSKITFIPSVKPPPTRLNSISEISFVNTFGKIRLTAILSLKIFAPR